MATGPTIGWECRHPRRPHWPRGARPASCRVGDVGVGSDHPVSVQSMTTTKTHDVNATLQQIAELTATGCDIVRVACPRQEDADALADDRQAEPDPGHRRHPLPAAATSSPRSTRAAPRCG